LWKPLTRWSTAQRRFKWSRWKTCARHRRKHRGKHRRRFQGKLCWMPPNLLLTSRPMHRPPTRRLPMVGCCKGLPWPKWSTAPRRSRPAILKACGRAHRYWQSQQRHRQSQQRHHRAPPGAIWMRPLPRSRQRPTMPAGEGVPAHRAPAEHLRQMAGREAPGERKDWIETEKSSIGT